MFDVMDPSSKSLHSTSAPKQSREVSDADVMDSWKLLKQAATTARAIADFIHDPDDPSKLRADVPLREAKDTLTAISTLLRTIRDSEELIRKEMSERLFRRAVTELLKELGEEQQRDFILRLREIETSLKERQKIAA